jgi:uncharacterized protein involved in response to NO
LGCRCTRSEDQPVELIEAIGGNPSIGISEGYLPAVMAVMTGFLFTAIPNWTGRLPVRGGPLLGLFALWLASTSDVIGWGPAAVIDCAFMVVVVSVAAREIVAGKSWRNLRVLVLILARAGGPGRRPVHSDAST